MITQNLISKVREFAKIDGPQLPHQEVSNEAGQRIATELNANKDIVLLGTLLMDCVIGVAIKENRLAEHIQMCLNKAEEILDLDNEITIDEKENILACVKEHHGSEKFYSLESEIVCNADCYRFASVKGFYVALHFFGEMINTNMIELYRSKVKEKSDAITLEFVKQDLKEQIILVNNFCKYL